MNSCIHSLIYLILALKYFVNIVTISKVKPSIASYHKNLALADCGFINKFTPLWPSPRFMEQWVTKNSFSKETCFIIFVVWGYAFVIEK